MEYPDILKKFNAFPPLDVSDRPPSGKHAPRPYTAARTKASQVFSFSSAYSLQVCFESTVGIATCLESLGDGFSGA